MQLTPNAIPENSMAGVHVGCFSAQDDDPNQAVSLLLVDSEHKMFASYHNGSQLCLTVGDLMKNQSFTFHSRTGYSHLENFIVLFFLNQIQRY